MKIAILGYGKMGKIIEELALQRGHTISVKTDRAGFVPDDIRGSDVAIEFSIPTAAPGNIRNCIKAGVPVVVGTTAWYEHFNEIKSAVLEKNGSLLTATNFSIGVNIFFEINRRLAEMMNPYEEYDVEVDEIHHLQKLDAPSGTGITIADGIISELDRKKQWVCQEGDNQAETSSLDLKIVSHREKGVPGTHEVHYNSEIDSIKIKHTAHNRKGFALGSIVAAEWLSDKTGVFTMKDVLSKK